MSSTGSRAPQGRHRLHQGRSRALTALLALIVAVIGLTSSGLALPSAAPAQTPGITTTLLINGQPASGVPTVKSGDQEQLQVQYDNTVAPGSTVKIKLGDNVTLGTLPEANTAVQSITKGADGTVDITFKDPWPTGVNQGIVNLAFTVNPVDSSGEQQITWNVDGTANSQNVTVLKPGDSPAPTTPADAKSVSPTDLNKYVTVAADGTVTLNPSIADQAIAYTLTLTSTEAQSDFPISDQLPSYLGYDASSFKYTLTTWDSNGLNKSTSASAAYPVTVSGNSFTSTTSVPGPSVLAITYTVHVTDVEGLAAALQAELEGKSGGTSYTLALQNTASFNGNTDKATVNVKGTVPSGPCTLCATLSKASSWDSRNVHTDANGNLTPAQEITYTLNVNTSSTSSTLPQNAVLSDPLPTGASWDTDDSSFITTNNGVTLTEAASCPDATTFAADSYVNQWCVSGQTLLVNLGANKPNVSVNAKALVDSVSALTKGGTTEIDGATAYQLPNTASLTYGAANPVTATKTVTVVQLPTNGGNGYNDPGVFAKTTSPSSITVQPGQSTTVRYTFTVNPSKDTSVNATDAKIVDTVDPNVFGTADQAAIASTLSGKYGSTALDASDFTATVDTSTNKVTIALSDTGKAKAIPADQSWSVNLSLVTAPVTGTQTLAVSNSAVIYGSQSTPLYNSTVSSQVSSYGDEAEVRKTVWNSDTSAWTSNLRAKLNEDGTLVKDDFVYRVQFIPHGNYNNVVIIPVNDVLPAGTSFVGFVTEANAGTGANPTSGPVDIGGNIQASYDSATRTVTLSEKDGTRLDASQTIAAFFEVHVDSFTADVPIVNTIGTTSATITPTDGYPLTIAKQDPSDRGKVIDDPDARFQLKDADGKVVVDDICVSKGYLRVDCDSDQPSAVKVSEPGTYTLSEVTPPVGYVKSDATLQFVVTADSIPDEQTFFDDPVGPSVSVGDYVWVDSNRDGRQDVGEPGIPGVVLTITGPDGKPVTGVNGLPVGPQTTDANGKYSFDGLPVLSDGQHYTVSIDRDASETALAPYTPTKAGQGERGGDSSTWSAQSEGLTVDGQRDPTLDFGFVTKTYAIGDKVWIDTNRNGIQDGGEKPLAGVKVTLLDGDGKTVGITTTDANGRYVFDDLPAGTYRVKFELTAAQAAKYKFTGLNKGDVESDSDANPGTGLTKTFVLGDEDANLTKSYDYRTVNASEGIDPTWDAGVVLVSDPSTGGGSGNGAGANPGKTPLAFTGSDIGGMIAVALLALLGGVTLLLVGRRRRTG